jgi:hypothetical protein
MSSLSKKKLRYSGNMHKPTPRHNPIRKSRKSRKTSRKSRKTPRKSRKTSRKSRKTSRKTICKNILKSKIKVNMEEYKLKKRWKSPKQAIAVAYAQSLKIDPKCGKIFKRK